MHGHSLCLLVLIVIGCANVKFIPVQNKKRFDNAKKYCFPVFVVTNSTKVGTTVWCTREFLDDAHLLKHLLAANEQQQLRYSME